MIDGGRASELLKIIYKITIDLKLGNRCSLMIHV